MNEGKLILTCQPFLQNHGATPKITTKTSMIWWGWKDSMSKFH